MIDSHVLLQTSKEGDDWTVDAVVKIMSYSEDTNVMFVQNHGQMKTTTYPPTTHLHETFCTCLYQKGLK